MSEEERREAKRVSMRERSRQWFLTVGTALALLATTIGFLSDSLGVVEFLQSRGAMVPTPAPVTTISPGGSTLNGEVHTLGPQSTGEIVSTPGQAISRAPRVTNPALITPTGTTPVTPTLTPLPVVAVANERLLLVAQFSNFAVDANYNVAGRIHEALADQVESAELDDTRVAVWPEVVIDQTHAGRVLGNTGAAMVIWGEYDSGRVRVRFALEEGKGDLEWQRLLGAPTELSTTINLDVPRETQVLALTVLGRLYRNAGDLTRARAAFSRALAQNPSDVDTLATLSFYLAVLDAAASPPDLDRAITSYTTVIELRPAWVNARFNRGIAYLARYWQSATAADLDAAIEDFGWTIDAKGNYAEAYINRAIAYYARNNAEDMERAIADLNDAVRYSPTSYRAYYNRGLVYIRLGQRAQWETDLTRALALEPAYWVAHHALCWGYALDEMADRALPHCDIAREHDPSGSTLDGRGLALAQLGRTEEARADLETYLAWLETQPAAWSAINNHAIYLEIIRALEADEQPVTTEVLAQLR